MMDVFLAHLNFGRNVIPNKQECKHLSVNHAPLPVKN